ncbi:hypothetical protein KIN20_009563 [Parelaphostrongylus tenuis]|uniref:Uncharacterized protein n=1 Tax=Parelaphostrongylus tenuis TaxID=148309 RepID=A0AAD5QIB7_PARTN|nr:hypothetical protein KIN20_009563 [Parelaphostrongylus tenuis]
MDFLPTDSNLLAHSVPKTQGGIKENALGEYSGLIDQDCSGLIDQNCSGMIDQDCFGLSDQDCS